VTDDVYAVQIEQKDRRLGRNIVHDPRSRMFALPMEVDRSAWKSKRIGVYDPKPNPNQSIGNCTGVAKCVAFNAIGNRKKGVVLNMNDAVKIYSLATTLDPFPGSYSPDDTGSSGLAAAQAAQRLGLGGTYRWIFNGADGVVQAVMEGHVVNVGTRWDYPMFSKDKDGIIHPGGQQAGGHEWSVRGYDKERDLVLGRCWWGLFKDFWIKRVDLQALLDDDGDALVQERV